MCSLSPWYRPQRWRLIYRERASRNMEFWDVMHTAKKDIGFGTTINKPGKFGLENKNWRKTACASNKHVIDSQLRQRWSILKISTFQTDWYVRTLQGIATQWRRKFGLVRCKAYLSRERETRFRASVAVCPVTDGGCGRECGRRIV